MNILSKYELTDQFEDVTLLFADIAGFTKFSNSHSPEEVVSMLRTLFTEFDKSCLKYKVYKVYTIGDCYVVMGFTNSIKRNPVEEAKNVVKMGLSMIEVIKEVKKVIDFKDMNMRIGIHTVLIRTNLFNFFPKKLYQGLDNWRNHWNRYCKI